MANHEIETGVGQKTEMVWKRNFLKELSMFPGSLMSALVGISNTTSEPNLQTAVGMWNIWPTYKEKVPQKTQKG